MGLLAVAKKAPANSTLRAQKKIAAAPVLNTDHKEPLKPSGALEGLGLNYHDISPFLGREYNGVNIVDLLRAPNSDELIRDLAITSEFVCPICLD